MGIKLLFQPRKYQHMLQTTKKETRNGKMNTYLIIGAMMKVSMNLFSTEGEREGEPCDLMWYWFFLFLSCLHLKHSFVYLNCPAQVHTHKPLFTYSLPFLNTLAHDIRKKTYLTNVCPFDFSLPTNFGHWESKKLHIHTFSYRRHVLEQHLDCWDISSHLLSSGNHYKVIYSQYSWPVCAYVQHMCTW